MLFGYKESRRSWEVLGCCYSVLERWVREIIKWEHGTCIILAKAVRDTGWMNLQTCTRNNTCPFNTRLSVGTCLHVKKNAVRLSSIFTNFAALRLFIFNKLYVWFKNSSARCVTKKKKNTVMNTFQRTKRVLGNPQGHSMLYNLNVRLSGLVAVHPFILKRSSYFVNCRIKNCSFHGGNLYSGFLETI